MEQSLLQLVQVGGGGAECVTISASGGGVEQSLLQLVLVGEGWSRVCYNKC